MLEQKILLIINNKKYTGTVTLLIFKSRTELFLLYILKCVVHWLHYTVCIGCQAFLNIKSVFTNLALRQMEVFPDLGFYISPQSCAFTSQISLLNLSTFQNINWEKMTCVTMLWLTVPLFNHLTSKKIRWVTFLDTSKWMGNNNYNCHDV